MPSEKLQTLKNGLSVLLKQIEPRKNELTAKLGRGETISDEDAQWLDHAGNIVDEQRVVDILGAAEDYEAAFASLSAADKVTVGRLQELGENLPSISDKARKRASKFNL